MRRDKRMIRKIRTAVCASLMAAAMITQGISPAYAATAVSAGSNADESAESTTVGAVGSMSSVSAGSTAAVSVGSTASGSDKLDAVEATCTKCTGWLESIHAEISGMRKDEVSDVRWSGKNDFGAGVDQSLSGTDLKYLVREVDDENIIIDIPGVAPGTYTFAVNEPQIQVENLKVYPYDRSGYAHFNYTEGVGAYNPDGTAKDGAVILYVTDDNKNEVELEYGGSTVTGIGDILNSSSSENNSIIQDLADDNVPLIVRFIGCVSETGLYTRGTFDATSDGCIDGLSEYGGTDNGHMATMKLGKNITLEGIGNDAVIDGWGFSFAAGGEGYGKNFEVRNLKFINTPEDGVGMEGSQYGTQISAAVERCWVHNNEFYCPTITNPAESDKAQGDGSVDFKRGQYFTCSYNYFEGCHKTNLVGAGNANLQFNLSYHHNYWYMCDQRSPLTRHANVHMYNNISEMQTGYCQNTRANAYIFSEYNMFYACQDPQKVESSQTDSTDVNENKPAVKSFNDSIASALWSSSDTKGTTVEDKSTAVDNNCEYTYGGISYRKFETDPELSYIPEGDYELQTDFTELRQVIASSCGVQPAEIKQPEDITADDYSIIDRSGASVNEISTLPYTTAPGKQSGTAYAFTVDRAFDLKVAYEGSSCDGVLVNEGGENLLTGAGTVKNLPAGTYMIQPYGFSKATYSADSSSFVTWKSFKITTFNLTAATEYTLTFDYNYDGKPDPLTSKVVEGTSYASMSDLAPSSFTRDNYRLEGLYTDAGCSTAVTYPYTVTGDKTLYANWLADTVYSIKFVSDHGTTTMEDTTATEGSVITLTDCTPDTGYSFSGWSINGSGISGSSYTVNASDATDGVITISAVYSKVMYELYFKYNYEDAPDDVMIEKQEGTVLSSMSFMVPSSFVRSGYALEELYIGDQYSSSEEKVTFPFTVTGGNQYHQIWFYAKWTENTPVITTYTVKFDPSGGTTTMTDVTAEAGDVITLTDCTPPDGFTFKGWTINGETLIAETTYTVSATDAVNGVITLKALYEVKPDPEGLHIALAEPGVTYTYTGLPIKPEVIVTNNGVTLIEVTDYTIKYSNNVKAAKASDKKAPTITVTGKGDLSGKAKATFTIEQRDISNADMDDEPYVASGTNYSPAMAYEGIPLTKKDFDLGSATTEKITADKEITITGTGNFKGSRTVSANAVDKKTLKKLKVTVSKQTSDEKDLIYTGEKVKPKVTVKDPSGTELTEGTDYVISWPEDTVNAGSKKFTVLGLNEYAGSYKKSYSIKPRKAENIDCVGSVPYDQNIDCVGSVPYDPNGAVLGTDELTVTSEYGNLTNGKDFTIKYSNNKKAGTGKFTLKFLNNYKGTKNHMREFCIEAANLKSLEESGYLEVIAADKAVKKASVSKSVPFVSIYKSAVKSGDLEVKYYTDSDCKNEMTGKNPADPTGEGAVTDDNGNKYVVIYAKITGKGKNIETGDDNGIVTSYKVWLAPSDAACDMSKAQVISTDATCEDNGKALKSRAYTGTTIEPLFKVDKKGGAGTIENSLYNAVCINNLHRGKATVVVNSTADSGYVGGKVQNFTIKSAKLQDTKTFTDDMKDLFSAE